MALITCSECEKELSDKADKCPHCGAPRKPAKTSGCTLIVGALAGLVVLIFILGVVSDPKPAGPAAAKPANTQAPAVSLAISASELEVTNDSTTPWPEMVIYLNDAPGGFKLTAAAPAVGKSTRVPLNQFVDKKGQRYNPALHGVVSIWIGGSGRDFIETKVR
jgi:hypothetical protein